MFPLFPCPAPLPYCCEFGDLSLLYGFRRTREQRKHEAGGNCGVRARPEA